MDPTPTPTPEPTPTPIPDTSVLDALHQLSAQSDVLLTAVVVFGIFLVLLLGIITVRAIY
jgi:hypothetical protein